MGNRKANTLLALLAISAGVFIFLSTASVSSHFRELSSNLNKNFTGKVFICEKKGFWIGSGLISEEKLPEIEALAEIGEAVPVLSSSFDADEILVMGIPFIAIGIPYEQLPSYIDENMIMAGRAQKGDYVIAGWDFARSKNIAVGDRIKIREQEFTVSGILGKTSSILDRQIITELEALRKALKRQHLLTFIIVSPAPNVTDEQIKAAVTEKISWLQVVSSREVAEEVRHNTAFWDSLAAVFFLISGFSSFLSLSISMTVSLMERKKEIAVKKAIGAENRHIFSELLTENVLLTIMGWSAGLLFTVLFIILCGAVPALRSADVFRLTAATALLSLLWSLFIALISNLLIIRTIAGINPMEVLKEG